MSDVVGKPELSQVHHFSETSSSFWRSTSFEFLLSILVAFHGNKVVQFDINWTTTFLFLFLFCFICLFVFTHTKVILTCIFFTSFGYTIGTVCFLTFVDFQCLIITKIYAFL